MRDVTQPTPAIKITQQQLECVKCGAQTHATCNCGMSYIPVQQRVAEYDKANPGQSTRQAASELGVSHESVRQARAVNQLTPDTVTGRDGKTYPATKPEPDDTPIVYEHKADRSLALQIIDIGCKVMANSLQGSRDGLARLNRVREEMRKHWDVTWF